MFEGVISGICCKVAENRTVLGFPQQVVGILIV
jgi:hypothetical protein